MATYQMSLLTPQPAAQVFDYLARFSNAVEWDPGVVSGRAMQDGPLRLGSTFRLGVRFARRSLELEYEVIDLVPGSRVVLRAENSLVRSTDTITVSPVPDGGAQVGYHAVLEPTKARLLLGPLLAWSFRRTGERARAGLEAKLAG